MKKYTRMLAIFEICAIIFLIVSENYTKQVIAQTNGLRENYIKIDVLLYNSSDKFISLVHQNLEEIQKQEEPFHLLLEFFSWP